MSFNWNVHALLSVLTMVLSLAGATSEEILIIEQDYTLLDTGSKGVVEAKDVRQILYISPDFVCIDDLGGKAGSTVVMTTILLDLKNGKIINLNHQDKIKIVETFEARKTRIEKRKTRAQEDIDAQPEGPQRDKMVKMYQSFLDDKRKYSVSDDKEPAKKIDNVTCRPIKIVDSSEPNFVPLTLQLHPQLEMPYDNTEVLYLLQLIGRRMADFLHTHRETFKYVPMELHLDHAAGGHLDTKVISTKKLLLDKLDPKARGALGNPFSIPEYKEAPKKVIPAPRKENESKPD